MTRWIWNEFSCLIQLSFGLINTFHGRYLSMLLRTSFTLFNLLTYAKSNFSLHQNQFGFPGHLPPAHGGPRSSFLLGSEGQGGHSIHYPAGIRAGGDTRNSKSPSLQAGGPQQHKLGPGDGRTRTPPVTSTGMLYSGVVSGMPRSLSPKSASPEGQVMKTKSISFLLGMVCVSP